MKHRPIVFVDVETTGLGARDGHILEIGAVRVENEKVVGKMNQLLNPGVDVPWFITKLTGIKSKDVEHQPQFHEVSDKFDELMDGAIFAAHNVDFDYSFFQSEYSRIGHKLQLDRFCTAKLSRTLNPQHRRHSLDAVIARGGYSVKSRHRAYDDAYVLYEFYKDALASNGIDLYRTIERLMIKSRAKKPVLKITYVPFFD